MIRDANILSQLPTRDQIISLARLCISEDFYHVLMTTNIVCVQSDSGYQREGNKKGGYMQGPFFPKITINQLHAAVPSTVRFDPTMMISKGVEKK